MATIVLDIIDGSDLRETESGYECSRVATVTTDEGDASSRLYAALTAPGIPQRGDLHPTIPDLRCSDRDAIPAERDPQTIRVVCRYRTMTADDIAGTTPSIMVGTTVVSESTYRTADGRLLATVETKFEKDDEGNVRGYTQEVHPIRVQVQRPLLTYTVRRKESASPEAKAQRYVGKAGAFRAAPEVAPLWLCTGITGDSSDGGVTYDVAYEFTYNPDGWDAKVEKFQVSRGIVSFSIGGGGALATALDIAVDRFQVYEVVSFAPLNLPAPSTVGVPA